MIDLVKMLLGPILKFAFGSIVRTKITIGIIGALGLTLAGMWVVNEYNSVKIENAELRASNQAFQASNKTLSDHIVKIESELSKQDTEYKQAIINRQSLEKQIAKVNEDRKNDLEVFDKECGRFERLMQKKASLVVRAANRGTKRVFSEIEAAATPSDNH